MADSTNFSITNNTQTTTYNANGIYEEGGDRGLIEVSHNSSGGGSAYNVKTPPYNATGSGSGDDTAAIQAAMNDCAAKGGGFVYIPAGTYMINALTSLKPPSNCHIELHPNANLKAINTNATTYVILLIKNVSNVIIKGNYAQVTGDRDTNTQSTGEQGMCVTIKDSTNIYIENLIAQKGWGDGFYIGTDVNGYNENIFLINCTSDSNRRNGLSVISVKNLQVLGGHYKNTNGTAPQFGIDLEPNTPQNAMENVRLTGVRTGNNVEGGIMLNPINMKGSTNNFDVTIEDWESYSDGTPANVTYGVGLVLDNNSSTNAQVLGKIKVNKASIFSPNVQGVYIQGWNNAPKTSFHDVVVYNSNTYVSAYAPSMSGFGMDYNSGDPTGVPYGNITFERCGVVDTRTTKLTKYAFGFASVAGRPFTNINIIDPIYDGVTTSWLSWGIPDTSSGFNAKFNSLPTISVSGAGSIANYAGQEILVTAAVTVTLPTAATVKGAEYIVRYGAASGTVTLAANSGDTIVNKGAAVTTLGLTLSGTFARVRSLGGTQWVVVEQNIS